MLVRSQTAPTVSAVRNVIPLAFVLACNCALTAQSKPTEPPHNTHWAFTPPRRTAVPTVQRAAWPQNPIDAFIAAANEREHLAQSAPADRATLLRRLSLDLTGLPPSRAEITAFFLDPPDAAYRQCVDRLLASPQAAEHQARYWLDAARYSDTHGMEADYERTLWPWRDWVIHAFQQNLPFDQFSIEQLAGDLLPGATLAQNIATGFHRNGRSTAEGGLIEAEMLANYAAERVEVTGTVWLGLSLGCARCHDHKFDPITQRDFYSLFDFFHSIDEQGSNGNAAAPAPSLTVLDETQQRQVEEWQQNIAELQTAMAEWPASLAAEADRWQQTTSAKLQAQWRVADLHATQSKGGAAITKLSDGSMLVAGNLAEQDQYLLEAEVAGEQLGALRIEALQNDDGTGPGHGDNGNFVLTGIELQAARDSDALVPLLLRDAVADFAQRGFPAAAAIDGDAASGWAVLGLATDHALVCKIHGTPSGTGPLRIAVTLHFASPHKRHTLQRLRISVADDASPPQVTLKPWLRTAPLPTLALEPLATANEPSLPLPSALQKAPELTDDEVHALPAGTYTVIAERVITADRECDAVLAFGSDDGIGIWLEGNLVLAHQIQRAALADQEFATLHLAAGENRLRIAIVNTGGIGGMFCRLAGVAPDALSPDLTATLQVPFLQRTAAKTGGLREAFRRRYEPAYQLRKNNIAALRARQDLLRSQNTQSMVMRERGERRPSTILQHGRYDLPGATVTADTPAFLPPLTLVPTMPHDRLALARWLFRPDHPLTARVTVNRLWQQIFGRGLVDTPHDFGNKGSAPSHPELLDWLACELIESGWDLRHMLCLMVTSATYQQSATQNPSALQRDPDNRWLARSSRYRLDAETLRDQALRISGLLVSQIGGPSVRPYQPPGIWEAVAFPGSNTQNYVAQHGPALYRRSLYTFWKRTAPPALLRLFDAPSRETCAVYRERTNTPLQALALLNDVGFAEAARAFAEQLIRATVADDARIALGFFDCTARQPDQVELALLRALLQQARARFAADRSAATRYVHIGESPVPDDQDPVELAALTTLTAVLLNLDALLSRN